MSAPDINGLADVAFELRTSHIVSTFFHMELRKRQDPYVAKGHLTYIRDEPDSGEGRYARTNMCRPFGAMTHTARTAAFFDNGKG